jgi:Arc/MetJ-type ribon-helix-helix transcriptional regulator
MTYQFPPDVDERVKALMATGEYSTEDDVLRDAIEALEVRRDDLAAIQAGIDDLEAGRVRPIREVDAEIRERHGFHK